jgi:hypothetical protein
MYSIPGVSSVSETPPVTGPVEDSNITTGKSGQEGGDMIQMLMKILEMIMKLMSQMLEGMGKSKNKSKTCSGPEPEEDAPTDEPAQ